MPSEITLPILTLKVPEQHFSCRSCGRCCHHFTVQLRSADIDKLERQGWYEKIGTTPYHEFRGATYLKQDDDNDGACIFLQPNGHCRIHAEFGYTNKPLACQLFPFTLMPNPTDQAIQLGLSYACPAVIENHGTTLNDHLNDIKRMARALPELTQSKKRAQPIEIINGRPASKNELRLINAALDKWLTRLDLSFRARLCGAVVLTTALRDAVEQGYSDFDFETIFEVAFAQLVEELPTLEPAPPSDRQFKQLRQSVFAHLEEPKISAVQEIGIRAKAFSQFKTNNAFSKGHGTIPLKIGSDWPNDLTFAMVDHVGPAGSAQERPAIEFLLMRYLRARILGGRAFGPGYYNFSIVSGLRALFLMLAATGWLARLHAGAHQRTSLTLADVQAALLRTDRHAGRAPWLGGTAEKIREKYFNKDQGYLRITHALTMTTLPQ